MTSLPDAHRSSSVLTVGFGAAVAMWGVCYFSRLPAVLLPSPILLFLLLGCLFGAGVTLGRYAGLGWLHGALAGGITGLLNLLVLGSLISGGRPNELTPSALVWIPGSILLTAFLTANGSAVGRRWVRRDPLFEEWSGALVKVAAAATLLLLGVGGLVTSTGAGLAVVDWPNSFGYNMFLYPFSRMTGGVFYEHSHRLFGALVGLTTLVLAVHLQMREPRRPVRVLAWAAVVMVVIQGMLGGLRVTGSFTLSTEPGAMRPSIVLAMVHGVLAQLFFGTLVVLGTLTSRTWRGNAVPFRRPSARADRILAGLLLVLMLGQLMLGAAQRHLSTLLMAHIALGVGVVAPLAIHVGFRAWGLNEGVRLLQRLGLALIVAVPLQVLLGLGAFTTSRAAEIDAVSPGAVVLLATVHQWFGAVLLALAVALLCWNFRLLERGPTPGPEGA